MSIYNTVIDFIDRIFSVPISFLDLAIDYLNNVSLVTAQGINLSQYFSLFYDMPGYMQMVVSSLLISVVFLSSLQIVKAVLRVYYAVKDGSKWW